MSEKWLTEPERKTSIIYDVDVVVVGGGTAGPVAAIAAARTGASTVLIERFGSLGGVPTVGQCSHIGNMFLDDQMRRIIDGIPVEVYKRVVNEGGSRYPTFDETIYGKTKPPTHFLVDSEILAVVLMDMVEEAGVKLMLHTYFCDPVMEGNIIKGVVVQNKSGRKAVLAKTVVDTSGEADVAFQAGVPCKSYPKEGTYGLLMHIGNVDHERFMEYVLSLPADQPNPEFGEWLSHRVGSSVEDLKKHRYWSRFLDPLRVGQGLPRNHPGRAHFSSESLEWYMEKWEVEKEFTYVHMNYFRDKLMEAVDNGDLELLRQIDDVGNVVFNLDGVTGSKFRKREVVMNVITPIGFDAFDSERITKTEIVAHRRALEVSRFMKKYMPGFEKSYITSTGIQTMPRHIRMIEAEYSLTREELEQTKEFADSVHMADFGLPGPAFQVPYRIMVPKRIENLLVAGKCVDGARLVRDIPVVMAMGQAAGTAAALSAQQGINPRQLNVKELQKVLTEQHVILDFSAAIERT